MNQRLERLEWRVDVLAQALAEIDGLAMHSQHEPARRLARVHELASTALECAGHDDARSESQSEQ